MKYLAYILLFIILISCNEKITYYEYKNRVITSFEKGDEMYFYNGKYEINEIRDLKSYIRAKKTKVDHTIGGYIYWGPNEKIEILPLFGDFSQIGNTDNFSIKERWSIDTTYQAPPEVAVLYGKHYRLSWTDSLRRDDIIFDNIIRFSSEDSIMLRGYYEKVNENTKVIVY